MLPVAAVIATRDQEAVCEASIKPRYIHTHTHMCVCVCVCVCIYMYMYMYVRICIHIRIYVCIFIDRYMHTCISAARTIAVTAYYFSALLLRYYCFTQHAIAGRERMERDGCNGRQAVACIGN